MFGTDFYTDPIFCTCGSRGVDGMVGKDELTAKGDRIIVGFLQGERIIH